MTYSEKLKDPRWQKRRLEVFDRDNFSCVWCGWKENTLHVHHLKYTGDPLEAPLEDLLTLCEGCHEWDYQNRQNSEKLLLQSLKSVDSSILLELMRGFSLAKNPHELSVYASAVSWAMKHRALIDNITSLRSDFFEKTEFENTALELF